jgi:hypothetical protein
MLRNRIRIAAGGAFCMALCAALIIPTGATAQRKATKTTKTTKATKDSATGVKAKVLAAVAEFEAAYKARNSRKMLLQLMVPTTDQATIDRRLMWLRGYGKNDAPRTHPILFESNYGSFSPRVYRVLSSAPIEGGRWSVVVREEGRSRDEDGQYEVMRVRHIKLTQLKGKWYVMDYVLKENPEKYGFYVDDISDKLTPIAP